MTDSPRLRQIQEWLADSPQDPELLYAQAMEFRSLGDDERTAAALLDLVAQKPAYVASYLMLAQTLVKLVRDDEAKNVLRNGIAAATKAGNDHAASELQGMLASLE